MISASTYGIQKLQQVVAAHAQIRMAIAKLCENNAIKPNRSAVPVSAIQGNIYLKTAWDGVLGESGKTLKQ
jgi:hypothetical protein